MPVFCTPLITDEANDEADIPVPGIHE